MLEEIFHAWLRIIYKFGIELSQSQQDPIDFDRNLMVIQGSQVQEFSKGLSFNFYFGGMGERGR